ncbi:unnamed protein product [Rotaria magnacalcarata]|uniref:Uncharacterized protein n=1 Tax=Rotaria magnacalcarata TaxID=392030 RepID=A0A819ZMW4_9BILA|nr:unnamed protein product [Rotaria magnacalcarata]
MSSKTISAPKIRSIMEKAAMYTMNVIEIFDENICDLIINICSSSQMPPEYVITLLLPAIEHFLNGSQIRTNTGTTTNISFFTTIIGYPSVNKSSATEAILSACLAIEKHIGIKPEESRINCSATVESLLTELKNTSPRLIQIWDEAATLLQSFDLYKQGGAAYDRSIMCTLYNSSSVVKRQTQSGNITVENPVLNIAAAAHPVDIFSCVSGEGDDDGLMARFLFSAPQPCIPLSSEIKPLDIDEPSFTHLLYIIYCFNMLEPCDVRRHDDESQRIIYTYSETALKLYVQVIDNIFDEYTLRIREAYGIDQGLGSILGKAKVQISRLAAAIHATSLASAVFDQLANDDSLPGYYEKSKPIFDLLKRAIRGPVNETLDEMKQIFKEKREQQETLEKNQVLQVEHRHSNTSRRISDGNEQRHPEKIILLAKGIRIPWRHISLNHGGFKAATLHHAAENLQKEKLGVLAKEKLNGAHKATTFFIKTTIDPKWDAAQLAAFTIQLARYNISLKSYKASLQLERSSVVNEA